MSVLNSDKLGEVREGEFSDKSVFWTRIQCASDVVVLSWKLGWSKGQEWPFAPLETKGQLASKKIPNQVLCSNSELNTVCFTIKTSSARGSFVYRSLRNWEVSPSIFLGWIVRRLHPQVVYSVVSWKGRTIYQASTNHQLDLFSGWATTTAIKGQEHQPMDSTLYQHDPLHQPNPNFWHYPPNRFTYIWKEIKKLDLFSQSFAAYILHRAKIRSSLRSRPIVKIKEW